MNKNKFFYSYKNELNFLATHVDINKFETYHFTILEYIKNDLGSNYKFRNYKIIGPNFSKIEFGLKKFMNEKKTNYINSKTTVTFTVYSNKKENLNLISEKIKISYPNVMHALNSLELVNYISLIDNRVSVVCYNMIFISKFDKSICNDIGEKMKLIKEITSRINPSYVNVKSISPENLDDIKKIIVTSKELKNLIKLNLELKKNYPIYHDEIIKLLDNMDDVSPETITLRTNNYKLINIEPNTSYFENNFVNKVYVYLNLIIALTIFIFAYLKIVFVKQP